MKKAPHTPCTVVAKDLQVGDRIAHGTIASIEPHPATPWLTLRLTFTDAARAPFVTARHTSHVVYARAQLRFGDLP